MRAVLLFALLAAPAGAAERPAAPLRQPACRNPAATLVDGKAPPAGVHPLGEEPAAKQVLTVMRTLDGCVKPVVVREEVGQPRSR